MAYLREDPEEEEGQEERGAEEEEDAGAPGAEALGAAAGKASDQGAQKKAGGALRVPRLTFLYKLREGAAGQSFGLNVAQVRWDIQPILSCLSRQS